MNNEAESSAFEFFVHDNGNVDSRMSTAKVLLYFGASGLVEKEAQEYYYTAMIRAALAGIQQTDLEGAEKIKRNLEALSTEVKLGVNPMPTDAALAEILTKFQVSQSSVPATLWPSGGLLAQIRIFNPRFQPTLMTSAEISLLTSQAAKPDGVFRINDFFDIKSQAVTAAEEAYGKDSTAMTDGHGDAYRHAYWNALMTQRYGEGWTSAYGDAHEGLGANPPASEAMDLYNNKIGRDIAIANPEATPAELQKMIKDKIDAGGVVVLNPTGNIEWSNNVTVQGNGHPSRVGIPLPSGK